MRTFSFFEVHENDSNDLIAALNNSRFMDRRVAVEVAQPKPETSENENREEKRDRKKSGKWMERKNKGNSGRKKEGGFKNYRSRRKEHKSR